MAMMTPDMSAAETTHSSSVRDLIGPSRLGIEEERSGVLTVDSNDFTEDDPTCQQQPVPLSCPIGGRPERAPAKLTKSSSLFEYVVLVHHHRGSKLLSQRYPWFVSLLSTRAGVIACAWVSGAETSVRLCIPSILMKADKNVPSSTSYTETYT